MLNKFFGGKKGSITNLSCMRFGQKSCAGGGGVFWILRAKV